MIERRIKKQNRIIKTGQVNEYIPGDDGSLQNGLDEPGRFIASNCLGVDLVIDTHTGLMWPKVLSQGNGNLEDAIDDALAGTLAGFSDWHVPNYLELLSIVDFETGVPYSAFTYADFPPVWSSTTKPASSTYALGYLFGNRETIAGLKTDGSFCYTFCRLF